MYLSPVAHQKIDYKCGKITVCDKIKDFFHLKLIHLMAVICFRESIKVHNQIGFTMKKFLMKAYDVLNKVNTYSVTWTVDYVKKGMQKSLGTLYIPYGFLLDNSTEGASTKLHSTSFFMLLHLVYCCFSLRLFRTILVCKSSSCFVK